MTLVQEVKTEIGETTMWPIDYMRWRSTPFLGGGCCGGCNNNSGMNQLFSIMMIRQLGDSLANSFREIGAAFRKQPAPPDMYARTFYPYVNFTGGMPVMGGMAGMGGMGPYGYMPWGPGQTGDTELLQAQQLLNGKYKVAHIGDKWYAVPSTGYVSELTGSSLDELMKNIAEYEKTHRADDDNDDGDAGRVRRPSTRVDDNERVDNDDNDERVDDDGNQRVPGGGNGGGGNRGGGRWNHANTQDFLNIQVNGHTVSELITNPGANGWGGSNADENATRNYSWALANLLPSLYDLNDFSDENAKNRLAQELINKNPSVFDRTNGSFKPNLTEDILKEKLDLPTKEVLMRDYGLTERTSGGGDDGNGNNQNSIVVRVRHDGDYCVLTGTYRGIPIQGRGNGDDPVQAAIDDFMNNLHERFPDANPDLVTQ